MIIKASARLVASMAFLFILGLIVQAQIPLPLQDILEKNLLASGGRDKIARVQNLAFKIGPARYASASTGQLKILTGKDPVITDVILVTRDKVQRNSFKNITELTGIQKAFYQTMAKLYAGLFSLQQFAGQLQFQGLKSFGPEKFYQLSTKVDPLKVDFFLRAEDFLLKRIVFQGVTPDGEKYEVSYDFAPFEQVEGCLIPLSWFSSQVGTRGNLSELTEVKVNQPLESGFFAKLEVNTGTVTAAPGSLKGNMLDFNTPPNMLSIVTNWTKKDMEQAGLKSNDLLILTIEGVKSELVFYAAANELPSQNVLSQGACILAPAQRGGETFVIQFIATDITQLAPKLKVLAPIEIKKK